MTTPPYRGILSQDALDFAMGATNYGHDVTLIFMDDGVFQLASEQHPPEGTKSHEKRLKSLPFFDIEDLYCCESSLHQRQMKKDDIGHDITLCDAGAIATILSDSDHIVRF
ncbi:DsrE family protein [Alteromonas sp. H39]|uniref:DsrE family protein n=1 Tax=Alteromonas sp. H39 TaxID=3389876 RepID=UPI0039E05BD0